MTRHSVEAISARTVEGTYAPAELGESPLWDSAVGLRWLDIQGRRLLTMTPDGQTASVILSTTVTAVELGPGQELLAVISTGFGWLNPNTGRIDEVLSLVDGGAVTMNDGAIDERGRCWAGSAVRDESWRAALYCLDGDRVTRHVDHLGMSNGMDWSPTGDTLYHVDSAAGALTAWEYDASRGELGDSRVLRKVPPDVGLPDGLTVDADGRIWLAVWGAGEVWCLDARTGETTALIEVPTPYPTSCAFGGADLSTLYITTANYNRPHGGGLLYAAVVPARGRCPYRFAGGPP